MTEQGAEQETVTPSPYVPRPRSAPYLAWGVALFILALPLLGAAAYASFITPASGWGSDNTTSLILAWAGWIAVAGAAILTPIGVFRLADRADSA